MVHPEGPQSIRITPESFLDVHEINVKYEAPIADIKVQGISEILKEAKADPKHIFRPGAQVLEIGAGVGQNQQAIRAAYPGLNYTEVEKNPQAATLSRQRNPEGNIVVDSITNYIDTIEDGSLDAVLGFNSFDQYTVEQLRMLFRKIHKKLKAGGVFLHGIDQNQAPTPIEDYARKFRRTPDGSVRGRPIIILKTVEAGGLTTGGIYFGQRKDQKSMLAIMAFIKQRSRRLYTASGTLAELAEDECLFMEKDLSFVDEALKNAGLVRVDHNTMLNDILSEFVSKNFGNSMARDKVTRKIIRGGRREKSGWLIRGAFFEQEEAEAEVKKWEPIIDKALRTGIIPPKSITVVSHKAKYVVGVKSR